MRTDTFDFELPQECIAQQPVSPRDAARLLEVLPDTLHDRRIAELPNILRSGDLLVLNNTRVIPTRLRGLRRETRIEVTLHKRLANDRWLAFARPSRKLRPGDRIEFGPGFSAELLEKREGGEILVKLTSATGEPIEAIYAFGEMPLPPYIRRSQEEDSANDPANYQTIYGSQEGAVAAPTAGLHFTEPLFEALQGKGIRKTFVTLHVGAGTFLPIKADRIEDHIMHSEFGILSADSADVINETKRSGGRVIAVGSTSLRLIETAADQDGNLSAFEGDTDLFISPGYRFKAVDLFLTNFHLPRSTLFILVSAFSGTERMKTAYAHAISSGYRFYSYGDCCLLYPQDAA